MNVKVCDSCLLVLLMIVSATANVIVRSSNGSAPVVTIYDMEAAFGPGIPDKGIQGFVYSVYPVNACKPVEAPPDNTSNWIALIARDNCTFTEKIRNVQRWYVAAIVFNHRDDNDLETMHGDSRGIHIPSVFVGWSDGMVLGSNYCYNCTLLEQTLGAYTVEIDNDERSFYINPLFFVMFASVVGLCITSMIVFLVVKWCRDFRKKRRSRLSTKLLKKIPQKKFKKGEEYDVCAICLDDYEEGDKLRLLPCSHVYHTKCIDPWLTKNKRCCPICKRKVIPGDDQSSESDSSDGEEVGPSERTPLLSNSGEGSSTNRRSTFDNSGLPETTSQPNVSRVNEGHSCSSDDDTDQSDSEIGAVGGSRHVNLAKENPLLSLPRNGFQGETANQRGKMEAAANQSTENSAVKGTRQGAENPGLDLHDEENSSSDDDMDYCPESEVVFIEPNKKDEKKMNGVV